MLLRTASEVHKTVGSWHERGYTVGLVPTMGALHEGHAALVRQAHEECDRVLVSVFVNPAQFGPDEDLAAYPQMLEADRELARAAGARGVFAPTVSVVYPHGYQTRVAVTELTRRWCGTGRPGHFDGVATVICRLFGLIQPDRAYFGQKDYQQVALVRRLVTDLCLPQEIVACATVRAPDGLALSSRNRYLNDAERQAAVAIPTSLNRARAQYQAGERNADHVMEAARNHMTEWGLAVEYAAACDPDSLEPVAQLSAGTVLLVAAKIGSARLIDNIILL